MIYVKQLDTVKWIKGISREVAAIRFTPRELCLSHGIEFDYDEGGWGLGDVELALLQTRSNQPFGLIRYPKSPKPNYTAIFVDEKLSDATSLVNDVLCDLELHSSDILSFQLAYYRFWPWLLFREDDHGTRVLIGEYNCYPDAFLQKEKLERRGHKQSYFLEMGPSKPKGWTGSWRISPYALS
jgi:hypothetical protein